MIYAYRSDVSNIITTLYLFSWIFIGNFSLLNLFLAILLDGFTNESANKDLEDAEAELEGESNDNQD